MNVYKSKYGAFLTFGCESWILSTKEKSKIQAFEIIYLRGVRSITKRDQICKIDRRNKLIIKPVHKIAICNGWWM